MMGQEVEMGIIDVSSDALGRALLDYLRGQEGPSLLLESDDGTLREADLQPADFFSQPDAWPAWERQAIAHVTGAVLDLGAGAGRHSLHVQERGHQVTAVDASPGCVDVCRSRGIRDVRLMDLHDLPADERWDTVLLMGGNLGVAGNWEPTRRLLTSLATNTRPHGCLIGDSVDPTIDEPEALTYEERNRAAGSHRGHVRLRLHYGSVATPWWDLLNIPVSDVEPLIEATPWVLEESGGVDDSYAVVLRRQ
jgi:SAM-dependent methyltransferase